MEDGKNNLIQEKKLRTRFEKKSLTRTKYFLLFNVVVNKQNVKQKKKIELPSPNKQGHLNSDKKKDRENTYTNKKKTQIPSTKTQQVMDNSISDENITTVAAAAVVAASTITAVAGTSTITKTTNDCSPCFIDDDDSVNSDNENCLIDKKSIYPSHIGARNDAPHINRIQTKTITKDLVHKCQSDPGGRSVTTASSSSIRSQRSSRYPIASGTTSIATTTRKCVLTLDGYNYVIGKLLCENS